MNEYIYSVSQKKRTNSEKVWLQIIRIDFDDIALFLVSCLKDEKLTKKETYTKTEAYKLYSRVFWIFLPNVIKIIILSYSVSKLVRFFSETQCTLFYTASIRPSRQRR